MEMGEGEKVGNGDSGDEMDDTPRQEDFAVKLLFKPSFDVPTQMSGTIVYATTAVICESKFEIQVVCSLFKIPNLVHFKNFIETT